ncbi:MAG: hydrogenase nickel incorporation protein HypA/HybF [Desulforhopalus sp.]|jgi:hydrogenase nickel incorporation protein HypA/HybF
MHEFSLAQGLHTQLMDLVREHDMKSVRMAEVLIGANAGIVEESFLFGFNVLAEQSEETKGINLVVIHDDGTDLILQRLELE